MEQPDLNPASATYVGKYYTDHAVVINAADLPTGGTESKLTRLDGQTGYARFPEIPLRRRQDLRLVLLVVEACFFPQRPFRTSLRIW
jgi:hypothetical protein